MNFEPMVFAVYVTEHRLPIYLTMARQRATEKANEKGGYVIPLPLEEYIYRGTPDNG